MDPAIEYNDENLQKMFAELDPKRRKQALKGGFRRAANQVRRAAVANMTASGINTRTGLPKTIRAMTWKNKAGFRVTVGTKGEKLGYHTNRYGLKKPVGLFAEVGTGMRKTKRGRNRGRMRTYGFLAKTRDEQMPQITGTLHREVVNYVIKTAQKYGCSCK